MCIYTIEYISVKGIENYETAVVALAGTKWQLLKEAARRIKRTVGYEGPYDFLRDSLDSKVWWNYADGPAHKNPLMLH
jgi:CRISPR/Cas system CSM-associated protein Csm2 small subunit